MKIDDPHPHDGPKPPATIAIRGPEDADNYRIKVGRYGDRWYTDPLPADDIAPASEDSFPSVSTVKRASGSDWSFTAMKRIAESDDLEAIAKTGFYERYERFKVINKLGLSAAGRRGTNVHTWAECIAYGVDQYLTDDDPGAVWFPTVTRFFDEHQPKLHAAEFVCIHRTLNGYGYGGTADGIFDIGGKLYKVDWKSRGEDSDHGCYPEEAAQLGAYAGAEYIIVADPDSPTGAKRIKMPELAGGLVVSIKPDSYEVFPVDLDQAIDHFASLHQWWVARRSERVAIQRKWAPKNAPKKKPSKKPKRPEGGSGEDRRQKLYARLDTLTAEQQEDFKDALIYIDTEDLDAVEAAMDKVVNPPSIIESAQARMAADAERETDRRLAEEGGEAAVGDVNEMELRWQMKMSKQARDWTGVVVSQAKEAGLDFRLSDLNSQRRADIYVALTTWVTLDYFDPSDDEAFRAALGGHSLNAPILAPSSYPESSQVAHMDPVFDDRSDKPLGVLVGHLTTEGAAMFRALVESIEAGRMAYVVPADSEQAPTWEPVKPKPKRKQKAATS